ncbi:DAK2 domain-containing protein [Streptomyces sp. M19]
MRGSPLAAHRRRRDRTAVGRARAYRGVAALTPPLPSRGPPPPARSTTAMRHQNDTAALTRDDTADWLRRFAANARAVEPELTALDQQAGDGDFGANLTGGMDSVDEAVRALPADVVAPEAPLAAAAEVFLDNVGDQRAAVRPALPGVGRRRRRAQGRSAPRHPELAAGTAAGAAAIQRVGEARVGDKTLVDALVPAAAAARAPAEEAPARALHRAAVAANEGARATTGQRARRAAPATPATTRAVCPTGALAVALLFASAGGEITALEQLPTEV